MRTKGTNAGLVFAVMSTGMMLSACDNGLGPNQSTLDPNELEFEWRGHLPADGLVEIKGVIGHIEVARAPSDEAVVSFHKQGRHDDPTLVRVVLLLHEGGAGVTICAVYPTVPDQRDNACGIGDDGHLSANDSDVEVDFMIQLPQGVRVAANTVNGDIFVGNVDSDVVVRSVNGNLQVSSSRFAEATTVNGQVDIEMGGAPIGRDLGFASVNGNILLSVSADANADFVGTTVNGTLRSSFSATIEPGSRIMRGRIGDGGPLVSLTTVNGNVTLRELTP